MSGSSGGASGGYNPGCAPGYPPGYPPTSSSSYPTDAVRPRGFVDPEEPPRRMPSPRPSFPERSATPAVGNVSSSLEPVSPETYYTPQSGGTPTDLSISATFLSPLPETYCPPSQSSGLPPEGISSPISLSPIPGPFQHRTWGVAPTPLPRYSSGVYPPYATPPLSAQSMYGSRSGYSGSGYSRCDYAGPVSGMPYPPTTPNTAPARDAAYYETSPRYYDGTVTGTSCYAPGKGTLKTHMNFNVQQDVEALKKAMRGWTTDHAAIIDILCARSEPQRQEIVTTYKQSFRRDLVEDAKSSFRGDLEDIIVGLLYPLHEYLARELRKAIAGLGTDEECLVEILCTQSNQDIRLIKDHYQRIFKKDLEKDVIGDTSGAFRRLLVSMCNAQREENTPLDPVRARNDAAELHKAGVQRWGTDVSAFNRIIATQSYEQLRLVFREYNAVANHTVMEAIKSEMSGDLKNGFLAIVKCVYSPPFYFAETLYHAMKGLGTNDRVLKRVVVSRCEKDLELIKQEYLDQYKVSLASAIQSDTSGHYRKALLAIVQGN
ncbi:annexin-B12-like isoform X1 [Amblyomma americanum]